VYADYLLWGFGAVRISTAATKSHKTMLKIVKKTVNDIDYLSFLLAKRILPVQQATTSIAPNTSTNISALSIPCTTGVNTITARHACPALSKMFAKRSI
jgi:hypothetical protein